PSRSDFRLRHPLDRAAGPFPAFAFPFPAIPTLPDPFPVPFPVGFSFRWPLEGLSPFGLIQLYQSHLD
ncbi:hypothetical protein, partial [Streptomyces roseolilacinus]|uniref:hypothetical protein n=1 Tax=Streptomyces roseolilacinus TaxID=66904 RepID=UPI0037F609C8